KNYRSGGRHSGRRRDQCAEHSSTKHTGYLSVPNKNPNRILHVTPFVGTFGGYNQASSSLFVPGPWFKPVSPEPFGPAQEEALEAQHRPTEKKPDTKHPQDGEHCRALASRSASPPFRPRPPRGRTAPTLSADVRRISQLNNANKVFGTHRSLWLSD